MKTEYIYIDKQLQYTVQQNDEKIQLEKDCIQLRYSDAHQSHYIFQDFETFLIFRIKQTLQRR